MVIFFCRMSMKFEVSSQYVKRDEFKEYVEKFKKGPLLLNEILEIDVGTYFR